MNELSLALALTTLAGLAQGTFGIGMRKFAPLSWEALWLIFSVVGMILLPLAAASLAVPDLAAAIAAAGAFTAVKVMLFAAVWGAGSVMFGIALNYLGLSLGYGVTTGLATSAGSLIPLFTIADPWARPATPMILVGLAIMLAGVGVATRAGILRDRAMADMGKTVAGIQKGRLFWVGLFFCLFNGFGAAMLNVAFTAAKPIALAAEAQGASAPNASLACWVVALAGGGAVNIGYALHLLLKNRSFHTYRAPGAIRGYGWALFTSVLWFSALALYGQGASLMGDLGPALGWSMFLGLSLVVSSLWGILDGEWKGMPRPLRTLLIADAILVFACAILGYAKSLPGS